MKLFPCSAAAAAAVCAASFMAHPVGIEAQSNNPWVLVAHASGQGYRMFQYDTDLQPDVSVGTFVENPTQTTPDFQRAFPFPPTRIKFVTANKLHSAIYDWAQLRTIIDARAGDTGPNMDFLYSTDGEQTYTQHTGNVLSRNGNLEDPWIDLTGTHCHSFCHHIIWGENHYTESSNKHATLTTDNGGVQVYIQAGDDDPSTVGDPHFSMWTGGKSFDYMGECDLVLVHAPKFDGVNDFNIHARTTIRYDYSYIETAAIGIGSDTMDLSSWGDYAINGVEDAFLVDNDAPTSGLRKTTNVVVAPSLGGYPIYYTPLSKKRHVFDIVLGSNTNITMQNFKDIVSVKLSHGNGDKFGNVSGMWGSYNHEGMLARDGITDMSNDVNGFGQEWQVRNDDPQLFRASRQPQYPQKCILPNMEEKEGRRLGEGIGEEEAKIACAHWKNKNEPAFHNCVYDVTATNDLQLADDGDY